MAKRNDGLPSPSRSEDVLLPDFRALLDTGWFELVEDYSGVHAATYDAQRGDVTAEVELYRALAGEHARIADLGCGTGALALPLATTADRVVAVDRSEAMIAVLRRKIEGTPLASRIDIRNEDITRFPRAGDGPFDLIVIAFNTLVHVIERDAQRQLIAACAEALRPGGTLVVDIWIPSRRSRRLLHRCAVAGEGTAAWLTYSQQTFPDRHHRVANLLFVPLLRSETPLITPIVEYVFDRRETRQLLTGAGLRVQLLPPSHAIAGGDRRRAVFLARRT